MPKKKSRKRAAEPPVDMPQVVHKPPPEQGRSALPEIPDIIITPVMEQAMALDQEGIQEVGQIAPRWTRKEVKHRAKCNLRDMTIADSESSKVNRLQSMVEQLANDSALPPGPKFRAGQAVFQWWSKWMKDAKNPPITYNTGNRPKWYSGEILYPWEWRTQTYAGKIFTSHFYRIH
jgi:hypothetical protein